MSPLPDNKVIGLKNDVPQTIINSYLDYYRDRSINTYNSYKGYIKEFMIFVCGKNVDSVTWNDILAVTHNDVLNFRSHLQNKNKATTVNTKIDVVKDLWNEFYKQNRSVDKVVFDVKRLDVKKQEEHYDALTEEEINGLFVHCDELSAELNANGKELRAEKMNIQKLCFQFLYITAMRVNTVLELTMDNLKRKQDKKTKQLVWVIKTFAKGKWVEISLPDTLVEEIRELNRTGDRLFEIHYHTLNKTLKDYCESIGIRDRNIVLHSIKSASADYVLQMTDDPMVAAKHLQHNSVETMYQNYANKNRSLTEAPSYWAFNKETDLSPLEELSKEELLQLIKSVSRSTQNELLNKLGEVK